ncbi:NADH-quinone oxidoreductase subunit N [Buchnera aphidicola (Ceratoglyphina bambusae)]|uniref:NADH-quinone oxidoreductase subunit N n=1 Tax=Buchnera aphidicola TaxID=9 RepID=UPI0031B89913
MLETILKWIEFIPFFIIMCSISIGIFFVVFEISNLVMFINTFLGILFTIIYLFVFKDSLMFKKNFFFHFDIYSIFFAILILLTSLITSFFVHFYYKKNKMYKKEYYIILLALSLGSLSLNFSKHMSVFFVSMEIITLSTVGLIYFFNNNKKAIEASLKYILFSSFSSIFVLFGIGLIYFISGSLEYSNLYNFVDNSDIYKKIFLFFGLWMILSGIFFKMSIFPFHFIFPDVYKISNPVFLICFSVLNKISFFSFLLYVFTNTFLSKETFFLNLIEIFSFFSMCFGNLLANLQNNIKRLLGYASISQVGYLMLILLVFDKFVFFKENIFFYFLNYIICNICIFSAMTIVKKYYIKNNMYNNIYKENIFFNLYNSFPLLSIALSIVFFSLSGIPFTIGFISKLYLIYSIIENKLWFLMIGLIFSSIIGVYLYFKIIIDFYNKKYDLFFIKKYDISMSSKILEKIIFFISSLLIIINILFLNIRY